MTDVDNEQRKLVSSGMQRLQMTFNEGSCQSIYDEAAEGFRQTEPRQDWLTACEQIRNEWGPWQGFSASYWYKPSVQAVAVEGDATFVKGACVLQVVWILNHERTRMRWMFLQGTHEQINVPPLPSPLHLDPPWRRNRIPA